MAGQTDVPNFWQAQLGSGVSDTDTTFPLDDRQGLTSPAYIVVDPNDALKVEVVLCDGTFTGDDVTTSELANRGLAGSADGAQAHDAGTTVWVAPIGQHLTDLWDALDGLASETYVDGQVATRLPLAGGTMTGAVTLDGDPTENLHAATKQYVDDSVPAAVDTPKYATGSYTGDGVTDREITLPFNASFVQILTEPTGSFDHAQWTLLPIGASQSAIGHDTDESDAGHQFLTNHPHLADGGSTLVLGSLAVTANGSGNNYWWFAWAEAS